MHDHLRDLGRKIAEESMPRRLWNATMDEVYDMLVQASSATEVRGIKMAPRSTLSDTWVRGNFGDEVFRISKLQLLEAEGDFVENILRKVRSPNLISLCWYNSPCSDLPTWIPMRDLRVLEVKGGNLERLWQRESLAPLKLRELNIFRALLLEIPNSIEYLTNLEEINLSGCESLEVLPDAFRTLANLQNIDLWGCRGLKMLPNSIEYLTNLQELDLRYCKSLEVLPDAFRTLTNLEKIELRGCERLKMLPNSMEYLTNLQEINLSDCESLEVLPDAFRTLTNLKKIELRGCKRLKMLPNSMEYLTNLQLIDLSDCISLEVLPDAFSTLANLQNILLSRCISLKMLPDSLGSLTNLRRINLEGCMCLATLPNTFGNLTNLQYIDASSCSNLQMPSNILGNLLQLKHLHLSCCCQLIISNETLGNVTTLECLDLSGCLQQEVLPLQVLHQRSLIKLNLLNANIKGLPSAPMVWLSRLEVLLLGSPLLKVLPPWLGQLTSLKKLLLRGSRKLKCLPNSVGQLAQLKELHISKCGIQYLPQDVMKMNNLETLRVLGCPLRELPFKKVEEEGKASLLRESSLGGREVDSSIDRGMIRLKELHLYLTEISEVSFPEGVCPDLKELKIRWCNDLVEAGALPAKLRNLDLRGCGALRKIGGLWGLAELEELDIRGCCTLQVEEVPGHESVISLEVLRTTLRSLTILKTPFETYDTTEEDEDVEIMNDLHRGVSNMWPECYCCVV